MVYNDDDSLNSKRCNWHEWANTVHSDKHYSDVFTHYFEYLDGSHELGFEPKSPYKKNLNFEMVVDHDGCSSDGWESNLYDLVVRWEQDVKRSKPVQYTDVWHREEWFRDENDNDPFVKIRSSRSN